MTSTAKDAGTARPTGHAHPPRARILAVDDDPGILRAVSRAFGQQYEVICAGAPSAALEAAAAQVPDVAIVDIRMPEMSGFELLGRLRAEHPQLDVILMTGNAEEPDANLVQAIDAGAFYFIQKPFDRRVLLALVARCLELRRLREEKQRYLEQLEEELHQARQFQNSLLPPRHAVLAGVTFDARYVPCRELAGDFFDYALDGEHRVAMLIADVVGHGASAAMMTGIVKSAFHAASGDGYHPLSVVERVREGIGAFDASRFITLFCAACDLQAGKLTYVNAGHPPPVLSRSRRAGGSSREPSHRANVGGQTQPADCSTIFLEPTGPLVCSALDIACEAAEVDILPGDLLVLYTDGIPEAHGEQGMYGMNRLMQFIAGLNGSPEDWLDRLLADVAAFSHDRPLCDDMTLLAARF
jgi:serine phosphatase RsbU (regulator of sigma subunit)